MIRISFLRPIDHFDGTRRLLQELQFCLQSDDYDHLRISVAFAKSGPLLRLSPFLKKWKSKGKKVEAIIGIDLLGTSKQALQFALQNFDNVYILHSETHATFHPKFYLFSGSNHAVCYQGSHNLTVGGTETNLEGGVKIELDRPEDEAAFQEALASWTSLLPDACVMSLKLDLPLLQALFDDAIIVDENVAKPKQPPEDLTSPDGSSVPATPPKHTEGKFPKAYPKPPSPIPKEAFPTAAPATPAPYVQPAAKKAPTASPSTVSSDALVIQIVPHHNGEVFLSKIAVNQNPAFFGYPFTGATKPKYPHNPSYPQRDPDPIVNITVYDPAGEVALIKTGFQLNTVYYSTKSEIRITFSPDLVAAISPYAIMVMRRTDEAYDYDIDVFNPGNPQSERYQQYLNVCNQTLPSGGKDQARRMGWL